LSDLPPIDADGRLWAVIESPQGSGHKLAYRHDLDRFELSGSLPVGMHMPFDFGFFPGTLAEDGDPLDVLILLDAPAYPGTIAEVRLLGALEAEQREPHRSTFRNDRLIAVSVASKRHGGLTGLRDLDRGLLDQIESYLVTYAASRDKSVRFIARRGPAAAHRLLQRSIRSAALAQAR
jgi:inorganic pyrophosphatase